MNRPLKEATVGCYHYGSHDERRRHLQLFLDAYNDGRRRKSLRGLPPDEVVGQTWTEQPERFRIDPSHLRAGPNT